jgi:hypothetical protein
MRQAVETLDDWLYFRRLQSKAAWLRERTAA